MSKKLSTKQQFVLDTLKAGGKLILDERVHTVYFSDADGNDYFISHPTVYKLQDLGLIRTGCRPAIDFESFVPIQAPPIN